MAAPIIDSVTTDKATYTAGQVITVTVTRHDPDAHTVTLTGVATDSAGNPSAPFTGTIAIADPTTVTLTDSDGRTYVAGADDGAVVIFTATA